MTKRLIDSNGFIEIPDNPLSKVGIYDYLGSEIGAPEPGRMYKVLRPEDELSRLETVQSFKGMPLVNDHTMIGDGLTAPEEKGIDGVIGDNVYYRDGTLFGNLRLYTNKIKSLVDQGKKDLSLGYYARYENNPGTWRGQAYDFVQRFITGNHVALVQDGRCGDSVAVLDQYPLVATFDHLTILKSQPESNSATLSEISSVLKSAISEVMPKIEELSNRFASLDEASKVPAGAKWITLEGGARVLVNSKGQVIGGAGGSLNGKYYASAQSVPFEEIKKDKPQKEQKTPKLKDGHVQLKSPLKAEKDPVWKTYKVPGIGELESHQVTIKNGHAIGVYPGIAKNAKLETIGEKIGLTKGEKEKAKKEEQEKKDHEDFVNSGMSEVLGIMATRAAHAEGRLDTEAANKRIRELTETAKNRKQTTDSNNPNPTKEPYPMATTEEVTKIVADALAPIMATMDAMSKKLAAMDEESDKEKEDDKKATEDEDPDDDKDDKKATEDEHSEPDGDEEKKETMDAKAIESLVRRAVQDSNAALLADLKAKNELVELSFPLVGTFDHSSMMAADVAKYTATKLGLEGDPVTAVKTYAKALSLGGKAPMATTDAKAPETQLSPGEFN